MSYGTRISSSSSVSKLLGLKAKRAALQQKIIFADTIKEQEKTLAKLKLQQELSEALAEEAVYQVALNAGDENNEDESLSQVAPKGFGSIIDSFLYEQKPSASVSYHVTNSSASITQTSSSVKQSSLLEKQPQVSSSIQSPTRVTQSSSHVTQPSSPVTQSSSFLTRSSAPISVSVTQTSALDSRPLVSSVPAVTQSSVSVSQPLPPVTHHSAYLGGGYTSSTPMTPHSAYLTTSLQQGLVTSPVMYQQAYQDFTPQSLYGSPPLYVPLQSQPPQPSPVYVLPSPDNTQQITEALAKVTQLHRLPQAKPDVFRGEEEDKTKFFLWESAFDALIDSVPVAPRQKLHLLFQHLEGRAKKVVEQLQFMIDDPEKAYKKSRKRLKYRFGNSAILSADFEKRLTDWPKIGNSDAKGIQEFSDFLQQVEIARDHIPSLKIFDFSSKLQSLVEKLPGWFKTKWSTKVQKLQQTDGHSAFPSFSEFVKEVNFHAERMNIPQISQASLGSINQRAAPNQSTSSRRGSQTSTGQGSQITALATQSSPDRERSPTKSFLKDSKSTATPDSLGTASTVNTAFCPYHRSKSHDLEDCQKFRELDFSERKDFLFKKGFCFNCASSNKP